MLKLVGAVSLLGIVCLGINLNNAREFHEAYDYETFDANIYGLEEDADDLAEDENGELAAIEGNIKYQDAARDALLKLARELRKGKNVTMTKGFLKVIDTIEKGIAEFHAAIRQRKLKTHTISNVKDFIKEAAKDRINNTKILRDLTSQGLFTAQRIEEEKSKKSKRCLQCLKLGGIEFLKEIAKDLGEEEFNKYLSVSGLTTLIFTIDTTGSMHAEIRAAIVISEEIVNTNREADVDYILSPFNDPETGPVTKKNKTQGAEFVAALRALKAYGGGDCPEMAFTGMLNALNAGPEPGSSMFVFTDASPKDATPGNINEVIDLATDLDIKINFFLRKPCGSGSNAYEKVAVDTGGQVREFKNTADLKKLGRSVAESLNGPSLLGSGGGSSSRSRGKRSVDTSYVIFIDDSIKKFSILVTTQRNSDGITLTDPTGSKVYVGRVNLLNGVFYDIQSPKTGSYHLRVPASAGKHEYKVSGVSGVNLDFTYYYVAIPRRGLRIPLPINQPLQGLPVKAFVSIAGAEKVNDTSLRMKAVDQKGNVLADVPLTAVGTSGARYFFRFNRPPSTPFILQLHGRIKNKSNFSRVSPKLDRTVPVLLKLSFKGYKTLRRGQTTTMTVQVLRGLSGVWRQLYALSLKDERGYGHIYKQPRLVYRARKGFGRIQFIVPADAPKGKTEHIKVTLTKVGEKTPISSLSFSFLLV